MENHFVSNKIFWSTVSLQIMKAFYNERGIIKTDAEIEAELKPYNDALAPFHEKQDSYFDKGMKD